MDEMVRTVDDAILRIRLEVGRKELASFVDTTLTLLAACGCHRTREAQEFGGQEHTRITILEQFKLTGTKRFRSGPSGSCNFQEVSFIVYIHEHFKMFNECESNEFEINVGRETAKTQKEVPQSRRRNKLIDWSVGPDFRDVSASCFDDVKLDPAFAAQPVASELLAIGHPAIYS